MKAGSSGLSAAVFVFICILFFVTSQQPSDLQVSVRFVIVIRSIRIHMESGFSECCLGVYRSVRILFFVTIILFTTGM